MSADFAVTLDRTAHSRLAFAAEPVKVGPWSVEIETARPAVTVWLDEGLLVVMKGQLYDLGPAGLLAMYRRHGQDFPRYVEGSYAMVVLDQRAGRVFAVTDRVGSHTLYAAHDGDRVLIASRPDWTGFRDRPLSLAGIGSVLVTGGLQGGTALYEGVYPLRRASVHEVGARDLHSTEYWSLVLNHAAVGSSADLSMELAGLLRSSVAQRVQASAGPLVLSLSGGYDSRGLLRLLAETGREVRTFSYALPGASAGTDAAIAARLAAQYGMEHREVRAYRGDLRATLDRNVRWGHGAAPFSDEADAWDELARGGRAEVFVGEQVFELSNPPRTNLADQLQHQRLGSFETLSWLSAIMPASSYGSMRDAWNAVFERVADQTRGVADPRDQELTLMLNENLPGALLPWRDRYAAQLGSVHQPYLDSKILDFVGRVPLNLLAGKAVFIQALKVLDPELLRVPLARTPGYKADWKREFITQRDAVWAGVTAKASPLDAVVSPEVLRGVLYGLTPVSAGATWRGMARQAVGQLRRQPLATRLLGPAVNRVRAVDAATFLRRALVLRDVLAGTADRAQERADMFESVDLAGFSLAAPIPSGDLLREERPDLLPPVLTD
ncbi:asparagine synthase (glutamine-hydrolyzing) [Deinococcus metalli]|uniref:asparagine synthase (glutamine-hydrolyzing) n=1 Tax=Deinococcus metalli TaxID=1141878 RepID=A0A7W8NSY4_9DEIO|nr:asparagine synthase-related protein [Deinococcus metalli]MBB5377632.1 asparagine synthase (glutamine-hydrolyzing) [Deinococcus metalli]GHF52187.1 hypothetical protein GCM10017781_30590 [Deinococcus metalli]